MPHSRFALAIVVSALIVSPFVQAQVFFGRQSGGVTQVFELANGVVTPVGIGLPRAEFPALSLDARTITFGSPDPAQADSTSMDLFVYDRATGQHRKLYDNVTQQLPGGGFAFASPGFSGTSADGQLVAFANQVSNTGEGGSGGGSVRVLAVVRSDGDAPPVDAEIGQGNVIDYFESEFLGITWARTGSAFVTPAYIDVTTNTGRATKAAGLVAFGPDGAGGFGRIGIVTIPRVTDTQNSIVVETHAFPAFSPDGQHLAFFRITYPDPLLLEPVTADLIVIDSSGNGFVLATFDAGFYPLGVSWSADGATLVFSIAQQTFSGGNYLPSGDPNSAALLTIPSGGGAIAPLAGAPNGYFPNVVAVAPQIFANGFDG
jgi:hypothetical protein